MADSLEIHVAEYNKIAAYIDRVSSLDAGSSCCIEFSEQRFYRCFVASGAARNAWQYCRKFVALDGTFTKTRFKQILLLAATMDGNDKLVLLAWGIVPCESLSNWTWFLQQLKDAFPSINSPDAVVISDRDKGLEGAIRVILPGAIQGYCCFHIHCNIRTRFGVHMAELFWTCVYADTEAVFSQKLGRIRTVNPACADYISGIEHRFWATYAFPGRRYRHVTSNLAEISHSMLNPLRRRPIVQLLGGIWTHQMTTFFERAVEAASFRTAMTPIAQGRLAECIEVARRMEVLPSDLRSGIVVGGDPRRQFVVRLPIDGMEGSCTCGFFQKMLLPCAHACALAERVQTPPISLAHPFYSVDWLRNCYSIPLVPIIVDDLEEGETLPPLIVPGRGRRPRVRIPSAGENLPRRLTFCSVCRRSGHNSATCTTFN